jgi:predicted amidohydrolase YtcJ
MPNSSPWAANHYPRPVTWEGPGFVDHHVHLLRVAADDFGSYDLSNPGSIAEFHRSVAARGSTPMDENRPLGPRQDLPGMIERGLQEARDLGIVEITEAGMTDWSYLDALIDRREKGVLPVRVRILVASGIADPKRMGRIGDPWLEVIGVKMYSDGWLGPRTCALCDPFADDPHDQGVLFMDRDTLCRRIEPFAEGGWQVATHAIGDRAITEVLDAYEAVWGDDCAAAAPRIEHAQVLSPRLMERIAHLGVIACIQPGFGVTDALAARSALGPERAAHAYNWNELLAAGARVIAGSDYPIESLSPIEGLARMVSGAGEDGRQVTDPVPLETTLGLMTDWSAGTTLLSEDPAEVDPMELRRIEVVEARPSAS